MLNNTTEASFVSVGNSQTLNLGYTFDGETFGNTFKNSTISVTLKAMAVQANNLEQVETITSTPLIAAYMIVDGFFIPESTNAVDYKTFETEPVVNCTTPSEMITASAEEEYRLYNFAVENVSETDTMYVYVTGADIVCITPGNYELMPLLERLNSGDIPEGSVLGAGQGVSSFTLAPGANSKFAVVTYGSTTTPPTVQIYTEPSGSLPGVKNGLAYYLLEDGTGYSVACADSTITEANIESTFNGLPVKEIVYGGFYGQTNLQSVTIGDNVETIGNGAFQGCTALQEVFIPNSATGQLSATFRECTNLSKVTFEEGCQITHIESFTFQNCVNLTNIIIPVSITHIGVNAFYGCTALNEIEIPNSVITIKSQAFYGCTSLTEITIPSSVTTIFNNAFQGCTNLTTLTLQTKEGYKWQVFVSGYVDCSTLTNEQIVEYAKAGKQFYQVSLE